MKRKPDRDRTRLWKWLSCKKKRGQMWTGMESTRQREDFSSGLVPALCVTIGHQLNQFKRLKSLRYRAIFP